MLVSLNKPGKILLGFISAIIQWALTIFMVYYYPETIFAGFLVLAMLVSFLYGMITLFLWDGYQEMKLPSSTSTPYQEWVFKPVSTFRKSWSLGIILPFIAGLIYFFFFFI